MTEEQIEIQLADQEAAIRKGSLIGRQYITMCSNCHKKPALWPSDKCGDCKNVREN